MEIDSVPGQPVAIAHDAARCAASIQAVEAGTQLLGGKGGTRLSTVLVAYPSGLM
jgi:hypothetical protein